jgi:hypothetical protein
VNAPCYAAQVIGQAGEFCAAMDYFREIKEDERDLARFRGQLSTAAGKV